MPNLGGPEIIVILLVALIFLGPKRLPEVGRQLGSALRELRKVESDVRQHIDDALGHDDPPFAPTVAPGVAPLDVADATEAMRVEGDLGGPPPPTNSFD